MPCSCSLFNWLNWFSDIVTLLSSPLPLVLLPPHILAVGFIQLLSRSTEQGSVCGVTACLYESTGKKGSCGYQARIQVRPLSAGPWSPGPPEEWWHWSFPTPLYAAPEERLPLSPGPSSPRMGGSGSSWCPPMPSYWGSAACPVVKRIEWKGLFV